MTQEEKQLLLKDLSARLPYEVKVQTPVMDDEITLTCDDISVYFFNPDNKVFPKPYLRPLSSMTDEEKTWANASYDYNRITYGIDYAITAYVDYLYSIHIDCHNLIPKGLALAAPDGMYNK